MEIIDELKRELAALSTPGPKERTRRAVFYATALGFNCIELLTSFKTSIQKEFDSAVKELIGLNLFLTLLDFGGGDADSWLVKFILDGLVASDKLSPLPPAQDVLKHYEQFENENDACEDAAARIYAMLNPTPTNSLSSQALKDLILGNADKRRLLLKTALLEPFETLDENVQSRLAKRKNS